MARKPRVLTSEHPYHITMKTREGLFWFADPKQQKEIIKIVASVTIEACRRYDVILRHFLLMSSHPHMIVETPKANISIFMQYLNGEVAKKMNRLQGRSGPFWHDRFKSVVIETEEQLRNTIAYIYNNPVRAKMVENPLDYETSTLSFYAFGQMTFVQVTPDGIYLSLAETDEERRARFIRDILGLTLTDEIRAAIAKSYQRGYYGSEEWGRRLFSAGAKAGPTETTGTAATERADSQN